MSQSKSFVRNAATNWGRMAVQTFVGLFWFRLAFKGLGETRYGLYMIVGSVIGFVSMIDLGLRSSITRFTAQDEALGDPAKVLTTTSTSLAVMGVLGGLGALAIVVSVPFVRMFFDVPLAQVADLWLLSIFMGLGFLIQFLCQVPGAIVIGAGRFDLSNAVDAVTDVLRLALLMALFHFAGAAMVWMGLTFAAGQTLRMAALWRIAGRRIAKGPIFRLSAVRRSSFGRLASFGSKNAIAVLGAAAADQGQVLAIGKMLGKEPLGVLGPALMVESQTRALAAGFTTPLIPMAAHDSAVQGGATLGHWSVRISRLTCALCLVITIPLCVYAAPLIGLYIGSQYEWVAPIAVVILAVNALRSVQAGNYYLAVGGGEIGALAVSHLLVAVVGVSAAIAGQLWLQWGLMGMVCALRAPGLIQGMVYLPWVFCRQFRVPLGRYLWESFALPFLAAAAPMALFVCLRWSVQWNALSAVALQVAACVASLAVAMWAVALSADDRVLLKGLVRRLTSRGQPAAPPAETPGGPKP